MFWLIKIFAKTLGETGRDALTMTWKLGYAVGSLIFYWLLRLDARHTGRVEAVTRVRLGSRRHHDRRHNDVGLL